MIQNKKASKKGQGATEYVIILVLVAIGSISVIGVFGSTIQTTFVNMSKALQGDEDRVDGPDISTAKRTATMDDY